MEEYDYRHNHDIMEEVSAAIDTLTSSQAKRVQEVLAETQEGAKSQKLEQNTKWFQQAVLPILKEYADKENALLTVEDSHGIYEAMFHFQVGFNIDYEEQLMRSAVFSATSIGTEIQEGQVVLTLIYDCCSLK